MNKIELFQTSLGFTTGIILGELTSNVCRNSFLEKSTREKVETIALAIFTAASIYGVSSFEKDLSPLFFGASFGLNVANMSSAGRCENRFIALVNLGTISIVFHHYFIKNNVANPEMIIPANIALGAIFYARHKSIDALLDENDDLIDENDDLLDENNALFEENDELAWENSVLAEQVEEIEQDAEALAREREEYAQLRAYQLFIKHHIATGHASPRQLKEARDRYHAINTYQESPRRQRSLARTRTSKMVANEKILKH